MRRQCLVEVSHPDDISIRSRKEYYAECMVREYVEIQTTDGLHLRYHKMSTVAGKIENEGNEMLNAQFIQIHSSNHRLNKIVRRQQFMFGFTFNVNCDKRKKGEHSPLKAETGFVVFYIVTFNKARHPSIILYHSEESMQHK